MCGPFPLNMCMNDDNSLARAQGWPGMVHAWRAVRTLATASLACPAVHADSPPEADGGINAAFPYWTPGLLGIVTGLCPLQLCEGRRDGVPVP